MTIRTFTVTVSATGSAPSKVVYNDGALTNGGTHATISAAIAAAVPGDIIELRNRSPGSATWAQTITLNKSGTAQAPITIRVRDGDSVTLSTSGTLLAITGSNVIVKGNSTGRTGLRLGNPALWDAADKLTQWNTCYPQTYALTVQNCSGVTVENATIHGARTYEASIIYGTATGVTLRNCELSRHGTNLRTPQGDDAGDLFANSGLRTLFEDCDFYFGGHNLLGAVGPYQVYRRCTFDASWVGVGTGRNGMRGAVFGPGNASSRIPNTSNPGQWGPQLVEECTIKNVAESGDQLANIAAKTQGWRVMFRGNLFYDNHAQIWNGPGVGDVGTATGEVYARGYSYHNTSYGTGGVWRNNTPGSLAAYSDDLASYRFVNNVFANLSNGRDTTGALSLSVVDWNASNVPLGSFANAWKGTVWRDNLFQGSASAMSFRLRGVSGAATASVTSSAQWPSNVYGNDLAATVNFSNAAARTKAGFEITSGDGFQDAAALATAVGGGTNATTLVVSDAGFFYDGWGISGETGDYIKIGSNAPVQITSVNWTTNTLTLATPISWANGASVYFAGNDGTDNAGTVFDNRGAVQ